MRFGVIGEIGGSPEEGTIELRLELQVGVNKVGRGEEPSTQNRKWV